MFGMCWCDGFLPSASMVVRWRGGLMRRRVGPGRAPEDAMLSWRRDWALSIEVSHEQKSRRQYDPTREREKKGVVGVAFQCVQVGGGIGKRAGWEARGGEATPAPKSQPFDCRLGRCCPASSGCNWKATLSRSHTGDSTERESKEATRFFCSSIVAGKGTWLTGVH
jgi:hypothetical protein